VSGTLGCYRLRILAAQCAPFAFRDDGPPGAFYSELEALSMPLEVNLSGPRFKNPAGYIEEVLIQVKAKNPAEPEFHQAVQEVLESLRPVLDKHPEYRNASWSPSAS
jgi:hypothetical protein